LPRLDWRCAADSHSEDADDGGPAAGAVKQSCRALCDSVSDCDGCVSAGEQCVWSVLQQRVCTVTINIMCVVVQVCQSFDSITRDVHN